MHEPQFSAGCEAGSSVASVASSRGEHSRRSAYTSGWKTRSQHGLWLCTTLSRGRPLSRQSGIRCSSVGTNALLWAANQTLGASRPRSCEIGALEPIVWCQSFGTLSQSTVKPCPWANCSVSTPEMHSFPKGRSCLAPPLNCTFDWRLFSASNAWRDRLRRLFVCFFPLALGHRFSHVLRLSP